MKSIRTARYSFRLAALAVVGAVSGAWAQDAVSYPARPAAPRPAATTSTPTPRDPTRGAAAGALAQPGHLPATPAKAITPGGRATDPPRGWEGGGGGNGGGGVQDAGITVIDFEALRFDGGGFNYIGASYAEDGFIVEKDGADANDLAVFGTGDSSFPGSTALFNNTIGGTLYLYDGDFAPFSLEFMEFSNLNSNGPCSVTVHGVKYDGTEVTQVISTTVSYNREDTFYFPGFNDLYYVYWTQDAPFHQFDNIGVVEAPIVMDFESLAIDDADVHGWGSAYYEDGFIINQDPGEAFELSTFGTQESRYPGSTALWDRFAGGRTTLTQYYGGPFNVHSIDISSLNGNGPVSVTFTGTREGGSTINKTFKTVGAGVGLQRFDFVGFNNLVSLSWTQDSPYHQFDNIILSHGQQTLDFVKLSVADDQVHEWGDQYRQDGFRLTKGPDEPFGFDTFGVYEPRFAGSTALFNDTIGGLIHLATIDNSPFHLRGVELASYYSGDSVTVHFVGHRHDGTVLDQFCTTSGGNLRLETFEFDGEWRNLDDVEWTQESPYHQFDNIRLSRQVALVDFQDLEQVNGNINNVGAHYHQSGFHLQDMSGNAALSSFGTLESRYAGSTGLFNDRIGAVTRLSANDGGDFDLLQMDVSQLNDFGNGPVTVNFVGTKTDGSQVTKSFTAYDPDIFFQTCRFVGFDSLKYVEWTQDAPYHQFDNIVAVESEGAPPCYPDCDGNGSLDLFDFLCFVNDFNANGAYSNCDGNGSHDLFDFLCYVNLFNAGC